MAFTATNPAQYSESPPARPFHTMTMAIQGAIPMRMSPVM